MPINKKIRHYTILIRHYSILIRHYTILILPILKFDVKMNDDVITISENSSEYADNKKLDNKLNSKKRSINVVGDSIVY